MSGNYYQEMLKKEIERVVGRLSNNSRQMNERHLYLTSKQYESDPDGWHDVLRQRGLPDDAIVFISDTFDEKGD